MLDSGKASHFIKNYILEKTIRYLYNQAAWNKQILMDGMEWCFAELDQKEAIIIGFSCERAFQRSDKGNEIRLSKKMGYLLKEASDQCEPTTVEPDKALVTDLTRSLYEDKLSLLSKGPKFAMSRAINDDLIREIRTNFCLLAYQLRWKAQRTSVNAENALMRYPKSDYIMQPPNLNPELETKLKICYALLCFAMPCYILNFSFIY